MKTLALDLSTRRGSVALANDEWILFGHDWANDRRSAAPFFETLERMTNEYGKAELIVVGLGPGSYTGTRIAIATGFGLASATGAQLRGLPSIVALADESEFQVVGDARRSSFFLATIREHRLLASPELLAADDLAARLRDGAHPVYSSDELPQFPQVITRFPQARLLLEIARAHSQNLVRTPLAPIYLREPHITRKS